MTTLADPAATTRPPTLDAPAHEGPPDKLDARLIVVKSEPFNAEAPLSRQPGMITPSHLHYVRSNFSIPRLSAANWQLTVEGEVRRPTQITCGRLRSLPSRSLLVTLECAGNGRSAFSPPASGEQWRYGAVSTAEWTGVPLAAILDAVALSGRAREIVIEGADRGAVPGSAGPIPFARSVPLSVALHPDTLLAYAMNGEPLPAAHGYPLRLIVPGWYGMAAVKWVTRITAVAAPFDGYFQTARYVLSRTGRAGEDTPVPLNTMRVRSLLTVPEEEAVLPRGMHRLRGVAWSGEAPVERVEVSVDGRSWHRAALTSPAVQYAWRRWEYTWRATVAGRVVVRSRAWDTAGRTQPHAPEWNHLGYANNAIQCVSLSIV